MKLLGALIGAILEECRGSGESLRRLVDLTQATCTAANPVDTLHIREG